MKQLDRDIAERLIVLAKAFIQEFVPPEKQVQSVPAMSVIVEVAFRAGSAIAADCASDVLASFEKAESN